MQITVAARVVDGANFELLATKYGKSGNYQVQDRRSNKLFFGHLKNLGAAVSYITLKNGEWTQIVRDSRTVDLGDATQEYHTTFALTTAPSAPPARAPKK